MEMGDRPHLRDRHTEVALGGESDGGRSLAATAAWWSLERRGKGNSEELQKLPAPIRRTGGHCRWLRVFYRLSPFGPWARRYGCGLDRHCIGLNGKRLDLLTGARGGKLLGISWTSLAFPMGRSFSGQEARSRTVEAGPALCMWFTLPFLKRKTYAQTFGCSHDSMNSRREKKRLGGPLKAQLGAKGPAGAAVVPVLYALSD